LNKKLRQNRVRDYHIRGGENSNFRIEVDSKNRFEENLVEKSAYNVTNAFGSALHFARNESENNAYELEALDYIQDKTQKVFHVSQTFKYWKAKKTEAQIANMIKKQDKLVKQSFELRFERAFEKHKQTDLYQSSSVFQKMKQKKLIKKKYQKEAIKKYRQLQKAKKASKAAEKTTQAVVKKIISGIVQTVSKLFTPEGLVILLILLVIVLIPIIISGLIAPLLSLGGGASNEANQNTGGFPESVEQWREFVIERCQANNDSSSQVDLTLFVNAILTTIQQESGGNSEASGGDLMQCKSCGLWNDSEMPSDWSIEQKSIDVGIRYFYKGLKDWKVTDPSDYDGLQIVAQGYNYGFGFLGFMRANNANKWTEELSATFSRKQAALIGSSSYGHIPYGKEWLDKYTNGQGGVVGKGAAAVIATAQSYVGVTESPPESNNVIFNTHYYGHAVSGDDYPWCVVFVWDMFRLSGNSEAFYNGNKVSNSAEVTRWGISNNLTVPLDQGQMGDIVTFDFNHDGIAEHTGLIVSNDGGGKYTTVEGNTGTSDADGGGVLIRNRNKNSIVVIIHPQYSE
ncbi:MAG: CHAP domain-containing protein, partial [Lachnospiraceae bacterium]|nr:CHAP domain-containing protein [Lachnospiraceae bacterium]